MITKNLVIKTRALLLAASLAVVSVGGAIAPMAANAAPGGSTAFPAIPLATPPSVSPHDVVNTTVAKDYAPKGFPGKTAAVPSPSASPNTVRPLVTTCPTTCFFYGNGSQAPSPAQTGVYASLKVSQPYLNTAPTNGDFHSLAEISVQSSDQKQIVEVGWNVDNALNGDTLPHLFVYHWVNGQQTCYNACGFVTYGTPSGTPGQSLSSVVNTGKKFGIEYSGGNWWVAYDTGWVGYFPGTLWSGATPAATFTTNAFYEEFGEVAAGTTTPCTDMGNGIAASSTTATSGSTGAAYVGSTAFQSGSTLTPNLTVQTIPSSASTEYPTFVPTGTTKSFYYGGPGWNAAGTGLGTTGSC